MTYNSFIIEYIHPLIIYVVIGTLISYLIALMAVRFPVLRDARSRAALFCIPFLVPFLAYVIYIPFMVSGCFPEAVKPLGAFNNWLCQTGSALASIMTPLFVLVVVLAVGKAGLSLWASRRLVRKYGYTPPHEYPKLYAILESLCSAAGVRRPKLVITQDLFARSFTMGYRHPVIVLSQGLLRALDDDELETVVAHELGHVLRADSLATWLTVFLRDLMFFTPLVFWVFRDLSTEKEKATDDFAVRLTGKPLAFAEALIKVWRLSPRTLFANLMLDNFMPHPNFVSSTGVLEHRVQRIIKDDRARGNPAVTYGAAFAICIISIVTLNLFC